MPVPSTVTVRLRASPTFKLRLSASAETLSRPTAPVNEAGFPSTGVGRARSTIGFVLSSLVCTCMRPEEKKRWKKSGEKGSTFISCWTWQRMLLGPMVSSPAWAGNKAILISETL